ncbi:GIY-YIG nuclease family protein [Halorientalis brevis]|uniref:GIY-YIG nuclease family protein n=1 Tax=Halorientalis brevis TaxID=1126241 RepID=A0ABD6C9M4_9EURY|nr:GIY-YIG nuclease family protein [Halorientalis brevis]
MARKAELWDDWIAQTLLADVQASGTPDPVPMIDAGGTERDTTDAFDSYRYGRGDGAYLYLLYLLDEPATDAGDITPVYIGETNSITSRLHQHFKKIRDALPVDEWADDGSWGSWSKYDHMASVSEQAAGPLYAWICDVDTLDQGPYGYPTYRQELEAKLVGLVHSMPRFERVFANREFVPNRVIHEIGKVGPDWLTGADEYDPTTLPHTGEPPADDRTKAELWHAWVEQTILQDIQDTPTDPIPLFATTDDGQVQLTENDRLKRSAAIDERIRQEGRTCVHETGVRSESPDGLLYVMYQIAEDGTPSKSTDIIPRYIGKAEAYGKKNELSANFTEIAKDRNATRSFARWGDGDYWHVGELTNTVFGESQKKRAWANALFEQGTRTLSDDVYLWIRAWDPAAYPGPYGYDAYLAEAEPLLIGLANAAYPEDLLNHEGVPDDAPVKRDAREFTPLSE